VTAGQEGRKGGKIPSWKDRKILRGTQIPVLLELIRKCKARPASSNWKVHVGTVEWKGKVLNISLSNLT